MGKERNKVLKLFIGTAAKLESMKNYQVLMTIISGLNNSSIQRIKSLWQNLSNSAEETFKRLDEEFSPRYNFRLYREKLKQRQNEAIFPYLAVHLRDLTYVNDGNNDKNEA